MERTQEYMGSMISSMNFETSAMIYLMQELKEYTKIHDSIVEIETGIEDLMNGYLSPKLISVDALRSLRITTSHALRTQGRKLCY